MVNDWIIQRKERPNKIIKIEARFLLDIREKINGLEKKLTDSKKTINKLQKELLQFRNGSKSPDSIISSLNEREKALLLENKTKEKLIASQKAYIEELESEIMNKQKFTDNQI